MIDSCQSGSRVDAASWRVRRLRFLIGGLDLLTVYLNLEAFVGIGNMSGILDEMWLSNVGWFNGLIDMLLNALYVYPSKKKGAFGRRSTFIQNI